MPELVALQVERALMMARGRAVVAGGGKEKSESSAPSLAAFWSVETAEVTKVCLVGDLGRMVEGHVTVAEQAMIFHCPVLKAKQAAHNTERLILSGDSNSRSRGLFGPLP